jgi:pimeloyl-ACP methyl ester carboxylesterase
LLEEALVERGITVKSPRLHRGSLVEDTLAVQEVVDASRIAPVVVGHSYGGSVITGLLGIHHLVYVAAFVPDTGESGASLGGKSALVNAAVTTSADGSTQITASKAREYLYQDCSDDLGEWAISMLVAQAPGHGRGVPQHIAWHATPSTYVVCEQDRALDPELQLEMARRCSTTVRISASHSPFISRPADLARLPAAIAVNAPTK